MMQLNMDRRPLPGHLACLSIQQPYAEAILAGKKCIELREWGVSLRGPLLIHTGKTWYGQSDMGKAYAMQNAARVAENFGLEPDLKVYPLGSLVGIATLVNCIAYQDRRSFDAAADSHGNYGQFCPGTIGWEFENVVRFAAPLPYRGERGLFSVPFTVAVKSLIPEGYLED